MNKSFETNITQSEVVIPRSQLWKTLDNDFEPNSSYDWSKSHAQMPTVARVEVDRILVLYASRDSTNRSRIGSVVYSLPDLKILEISDQPVLDLGPLGAFDDAGVMPSSLIWEGDALYLYYVGWNRTLDVPYHNSVGLAVSHTGGKSFERVFEGPVLDRTAEEPYFCGTSCVRKIAGEWVCWYMSCNGWEMVNNTPEANYDIKQALSLDGKLWIRDGTAALKQLSPDEAIARVSVHQCGNNYHMWFCSRNIQNYRNDGDGSYQIRHAYSDNGKTWTRSDNELSFEDEGLGQSSASRCYPEVFSWQNKLFMIYNGSGFGNTGFRFAQLTIW